jgi:hypothetical protein
MARILNLQAPPSMELRAMRSEEVERYASRLADDALDRMPEGMRPVGVNAVSLSQVLPGTETEPGFWAEWTRACCDRRDRIEDFINPVIEQFEREGSPVTRQLEGEHLESQMRIQMLEHPTMHRRE